MTKEAFCHYFQNVPSQAYHDSQKTPPQLGWGFGCGSERQEAKSALFEEITVLKKIVIGAVYLQFWQKYLLISFKQITTRSIVFHITLISKGYQKVFPFYLKKLLSNDLSKGVALLHERGQN